MTKKVEIYFKNIASLFLGVYSILICSVAYIKYQNLLSNDIELRKTKDNSGWKVMVEEGMSFRHTRL